jgi:glucosamine--fructose-6-phosphate aminotransferase (isomerizing)
MYIEDGEWGVATQSSVQLFDMYGAQVKPEVRPLPASTLAARKEGFRYFMEKEIYEQTQVLADILRGRLGADGVVLESFTPKWLQRFSRVVLCACGTSYHAALTGSYLFERLAGIPAKVEVASEFRYREPILDQDALFIAISQSGETADTLEALKLARAQGLETLVLCNVDNSSMVRAASRALLLRAGIEKGVASTKAFSAQVMTLWLLALYWGQGRKTLTPEQVQHEISIAQQCVQVVTVPTSLHDRLARMSKRYLHGHGFFFIGRDIFYPLALEGALKLKEISYLHAEGYPAGEMKHGPIALADAELFTIALMPRNILYEKIKSNVEELSARDSTIVAITAEDFELADDLIMIEQYDHPMLEFFAMLVVVQLLAMEIAVRLGNDVDMPRNLAKSVTVE